MNLSAYNRTIVDRVCNSAAAFASGGIEMDGVQAVLLSTAGLLENDGSGAAELVRLAEGDIEEIRVVLEPGGEGIITGFPIP